ncbi:hypothetical protein LTR48_003716 [Friedmanniomyces endolithicus]|nr:hypothetical protein LTR48_003716 [Friedmanniomyces endolithicus]
MASFTQKLREKLSKRTLRSEPSKVSMATQSTNASDTSARSIWTAGSTPYPSASSTPTITPRPSAASFRSLLLEKRTSVSASLRTIFTHSSRSNTPSPPSSTDTNYSIKTSAARARSKAPTIPASETTTPANVVPAVFVPTTTPTAVAMPIVIPPSSTPTIITSPAAARKYSVPAGPPPGPATTVTPPTPFAVVAAPVATPLPTATPTGPPVPITPAAPAIPSTLPAAISHPVPAAPPAPSSAPTPLVVLPPVPTPTTSRDISTITPIPGGNTAIEREEALAQLRKTGQVYPQRREAMQTVMRPADVGTGDRVVEPVLGVAAAEGKTAPRQREKSRQPRSTRETSNAEPHDELVVTRDLGDGLDAAVLARGGELERVIINTRMSRPTGDALNKLSKDLLSVSQALAVTRDGSPVTAAAHAPEGRTVVFNTPSRGRRRRYSVSELLDLVDHAVDTMHDPEHEDEVSEPADRGYVSSEVYNENELQKAASDYKKLDAAVDAAGRRVPAQTPRPDTKQEPAKTARFAASTPTTTKTNVVSSAIGVPTSSSVAHPPPKVLATPDATGRTPEVTKPSAVSSNLFTSPASTIASAAKPVATAAQKALTTSPTTITETLKTTADTITSTIQDVLPPIALNPQPYHHAPSTPLSLNVGQWTDKRVQEAQQAARKALKTQGDAALVHAVVVGEEVKKQGASGLGKVERIEKAVVGGVLGLFGAGGHPSGGH